MKIIIKILEIQLVIAKLKKKEEKIREVAREIRRREEEER